MGVTREALDARTARHQSGGGGGFNRTNRMLEIPDGVTYYYICPSHAEMNGFPSVECLKHFKVGPEFKALTCLDPGNPIFQNQRALEILKKRDIVLPASCPIEDLLASEGPRPTWLTDARVSQIRVSSVFYYMVIPMFKMERDARVEIPHHERVCGIIGVYREVDQDIVGLIKKKGDISNPDAAIFVGINKYKTPGGANRTKYEADVETLSTPYCLEKPERAAIRDLCQPGGDCDPYRLMAHFAKGPKEIHDILFGASVEPSATPKGRPSCYESEVDYDPGDPFCHTKCAHFQDCGIAVAAKKGEKTPAAAAGEEPDPWTAPTPAEVQVAAPAAVAPAAKAPVSAPAVAAPVSAAVPPPTFLSEVASVMAAHPAHPHLAVLIGKVAGGGNPVSEVAALMAVAPGDPVLLALLQKAALLSAPAAQPAPAPAPAAQPAAAKETPVAAPAAAKPAGKKAARKAAEGGLPPVPPPVTPPPVPPEPEPIDPDEAETAALRKRMAEIEAKQAAKAAAKATAKPPAPPAAVEIVEPQDDGDETGGGTPPADDDFTNFATSFEGQ